MFKQPSLLPHAGDVTICALALSMTRRMHTALSFMFLVPPKALPKLTCSSRRVANFVAPLFLEPTMAATLQQLQRAAAA